MHMYVCKLSPYMIYSLFLAAKPLPVHSLGSSGPSIHKSREREKLEQYFIELIL